MPKNLTKSDLVDVMAKSADIPKTKADAALGALVETVVANVSKGNTVRVSGLGTWKRANRKARTARNPQTGATVNVPASRVPRFSAATGFKEEVAGSASGGKKKATRRKKR